MAHHNDGNQNAKKEQTASSHLHVRCTPQDKALWVKAAQSEGMKLAEWVTKTLNDKR